MTRSVWLWWLGMTPALVGVFVAYCFMMPAPTALACGACMTGSAAVTINPASGPVGTVVQVGVAYQPSDAPATYVLASTTSDPASGGCATAQPIGGVAPFQLQPPPPLNPVTGVAFRWPAALDPGAYWICAVPEGDDGTIFYSSQPFTTVAGTPPVPQVYVSTTSTEPGFGANPGLQVAVTVSNWATLDNRQPHLYLLPQGKADDSLIDLASATEETRPDPVQDRYAGTVRLPGDLAPGSYAVVALGECAASACAVRAQSSFFQVTVPATSTTQPARPPAATGGILAQLTSGVVSPLVAVGIALLLLVLLFFLVVPFILRRRRVRPLPQQRPRWE